MGLTQERAKSAMVGVGLSVFGLAVMMYGTRLLPTAQEEGRLFGGLMLVIFGVLLAVSSLLIFVLPAAYDYLDEAFRDRP